MNSLMKFFTGSTTGQLPLLSYFGESMNPKYKSGDLLQLLQIHNHNILLWGESYYIITGFSKKSINLVRNLFPHPDSNKLILRSMNKEKFKDIVIRKSDMLYLFIIKGKLEINQL